jgi:violaxanthin de-epoxidase
VAGFTKAAVSDTGCVPQKRDDGTYPVPEKSALVQKFDTKSFTGDWYISAGLNPAFDIFDCQFHKFTSPEPGKIKGDLKWRIKDPVAGTQFVTRATIQEFVQDENEPGILYNHDNEFLHYQDDWYILAQQPGEYVLVYYRGSNDAWDGYGGAFVYSTNPVLDKKYYGEIDQALRKIGRKFSDFQLTDNTCKPRESRLEEFEADIQYVEARAATGLQVVGEAVVEEATMVEKAVEKEAFVVEQEVVKDVTKIEKEVVKDVTNIEKLVEKDVTQIEKELEKDIRKIR